MASRLVTLIATPNYQNSLSSIEAWRDTIFEKFINDGWSIISINMSFSLISGGYITIVADVNNIYNDSFIVAKANQILASITGFTGQPIFGNVNFKVLGSQDTPISTTIDTTRQNQKQDEILGFGISTTTILLGALLVVFILRK